MKFFGFENPPVGGGGGAELLADCERQLRPIVLEIVRSAVATGWSREDVLLSLADVSWELYELGRDDPGKDRKSSL